MIKQYSLVNNYQLGNGMGVRTCSRCGKPIASVYVVRDNLTGDLLEVGSSCICKILGIENKSVKTAFNNKIKDFEKRLKEFNEYSIKKIYFKEIEIGTYKNRKEDEFPKGYSGFGVDSRQELFYSIVSKYNFIVYHLIKTIKDINKMIDNFEIELLQSLENKYNNLNKLLDNIKQNGILPTKKEIEIANQERFEKESIKNQLIKEAEEKERKLYIDVEGSKVSIESVQYIGKEVINGGRYPDSYLYEFKKDNYKMLWKTNKELDIKENDIINIKGTIKENRNTTEGYYSYLTRCKIL